MKDLCVALVQTDIYWEDIAANLQMLGNKIRSIAHEVDLIALPEMFSTGFSMAPDRIAENMNGTAMQWLKAIAKERNCVITGSLALYEHQQGIKTYYNRLVWMKPNGEYDTYDKKHLFSMSDEPKIYTAGNKRLIQNINGWNICPMICYDLRFPAWARNAINAEHQTTYDVLLYVANWPERRSLAWRTLLRARAIENQSYVLGVNRVGQESEMYYSGDTSAIGPLGDILYHKEHDSDVAILKLNYDELIKIRRQYPFLKDADRIALY